MYDITDDDVKNVLKNSINLSFEQIFSCLNAGKMPSIKPIILSNGYGAGISLDYYDKGDIKRRIKHLYVSNSNGIINPIIADYIALRILGKDYIFIEPMSNVIGIFHYMKEDL